MGHTLALLAVAVVLALLRAQVPEWLAQGFELCVAFMLIALGVRAVLRSARLGTLGEVHPHHHGEQGHQHAGPQHHAHLGRWTFAVRPLLVGLVHGLAGSGALTALVLAGLPSTALRLGYVALFGIGSVLGMALLSGLVGWPLQRLGQRPAVARSLAAVTGLFSAGMGLFWGWQALQGLNA
jgi:hypothetical protein